MDELVLLIITVDMIIHVVVKVLVDLRKSI